MKFIAGRINEEYIETLHRKAIVDCDRILAAVAYADDLKFFEICQERDDVPLVFYGRYDWQVPILPDILKWFLEQASPNYVCRLVADILHSKVIWWQGVGAYIGSANLSDRAWYTNIEAGTYFTQGELELNSIDQQLEDFFELVDSKSEPLNREIWEEQSELKKRIRQNTNYDLENDFDRKRLIKKQSGLLSTDKKTRGNDARFLKFEQEWNSTLEIIRAIGKRVSSDENRPEWIPASVPAGAQADQFLHAYYYEIVRDGNRFPFEEYFKKHQDNPEKALREAIRWWREGNFDRSAEERTLLDWAPRMRELFAKGRIKTLSREDFIDGITRVFALRVHAKQMEAEDLQLPKGAYDRDAKAFRFAEILWESKSRDGRGILDFLNDAIWGTPRVAERLWAAKPNQKGISHLGINSLAELMGWARPDDYPPRNQRTSKALRALGYPVNIV